MENYLTFPVSRLSFHVLELCRAATEACDLGHGICLVHRETFLAVHVQQSTRHRQLDKEFFTLGIKVPQVGNPCETVQGDLFRKVKNNLEAQLLLPSFARRPSTMNSCKTRQTDHRNVWLISKDCKSRTFILINSPHLKRFHVGR